MESVLLVPFEGEGAGTFELTWGQLEIWTAMCKQDSSLPMGGAMALWEGATLEQAATTLRYIMSRHQSLRTRLLFDPDSPDSPRQTLHSTGEVPLQIVDIEADEDPQQVADELFERLAADKFDYADEWPIRMALVRKDGMATHAVAVYCHLAMDGQGLQALIADLSGLDLTATAAAPPSGALQPFDLARAQTEPDGVHQHEATVKRWRRQLAKVPARRFGLTDDERNPRHWQARYESPAAYLASQVICARTRADQTAVALAAITVELARITGQNPSVVQTVVHNRFRPGMADAVTPLAQTGLCVVDITDTTFDEIVARAWRSSIQAYMNSYYNPVLMDQMVAQLGRERGEEIDLACFFNDRRAQPTRTAEDPLPDAGQITEARNRSKLTWFPPTDVPAERFFITTEDLPDSLLLIMHTDTHCIPPGQIEQLLRGMEHMLVEAALDPEALTNIIPQPVQAPQASAA